jgi:hypothetical protein
MLVSTDSNWTNAARLRTPQTDESYRQTIKCSLTKRSGRVIVRATAVLLLLLCDCHHGEKYPPYHVAKFQSQQTSAMFTATN